MSKSALLAVLGSAGALADTSGSGAFVAPVALQKDVSAPKATGDHGSFLSLRSQEDKQHSGATSSALVGLGMVAVGATALAQTGRRSKKARQLNGGATVVHAFENELGVQPPTGFWDPAGLAQEGDEYEFYRRRCVEIKHGRVSMIASIGYIVPEYFKWPGYISPSIGLKFSDIPHGLAALSKVPVVGWTQIIGFCGAMELFGAYQDPADIPGKLGTRFVVGLTEIKSDFFNNYKFGPFGLINAPSIEDPELRKKKLNAEIANGRLAMFAIMAMMFQNGTVGTTGPEMWLPPN